jgi:hypothetical protein
MTRVLPECVVAGAAFWSQRLPGWDIARAVIRGEQQAPEGASSRPAPTLLAPTERRRAPDTVAVALEVAARACESAGLPPAELASVFASTHGDLAISDYMCSTLAGTPTLISPIKFHNSVHNAAAGYWSIGTGSYASYTAISAFEHTFGTGLLEAATQVACERKPVLYVAFDIEARGPLATMAPSRGLLGAALVLAPAGSENDKPRLHLAFEWVDRVALTRASSPAAPFVADNALAPCLPFFEALARRDGTPITLALSRHSALQARVS